MKSQVPISINPAKKKKTMAWEEKMSKTTTRIMIKFPPAIVKSQTDWSVDFILKGAWNHNFQNLYQVSRLHCGYNSYPLTHLLISKMIPCHSNQNFCHSEHSILWKLPKHVHWIRFRQCIQMGWNFLDKKII